MPQGNGCKKHKVCIRYNRIRVPRGYVFQTFDTPISIEVKRRKNRGDRLSHIANIEEFRVIGYYISEVSDMPKYLSRIATRRSDVIFSAGVQGDFIHFSVILCRKNCRRLCLMKSDCFAMPHFLSEL